MLKMEMIKMKKNEKLIMIDQKNRINRETKTGYLIVTAILLIFTFVTLLYAFDEVKNQKSQSQQTKTIYGKLKYESF